MQQAHRTPPPQGDIANRLFNLLTLVAVQQIIKLLRGPEHEGHTLFDVGQVGNEVVAETNGASVVDAAALTGQGQLDGLAAPEGILVT